MEENIDSLIANIKTRLATGSINIFGLPFSGKDTHGKELTEMLGAAMFGGGDIIRASQNHDVKQIIATGSLAPTEQYLAMVTPFFARPEFNGKPLVLSSIGRWEGEQHAILQAAEAAEHPIKTVICLRISKAEAIKRWEIADRGRHDDAALHVLEKRFDEFQEKTEPVIQFYKSLGLAIEIDAMPEPKVVTLDILKKIDAELANQ